MILKTGETGTKCGFLTFCACHRPEGGGEGEGSGGGGGGCVNRAQSYSFLSQSRKQQGLMG